MKRLFVMIGLVILVFWIIRSHRQGLIRPTGLLGHGTSARFAHRGDTTRRFAASGGHQTQQALDEARQALDEARDEVRQAFHEMRGTLVSNDNPRHAPLPTPRTPASVRQEAEGLPVPIVPGTRVLEAEAQPPTSPCPVIALHEQMPPTSPAVVALSGPVRSQSITVTGLISATEERAKSEARRKLQDEVINWLEPDVPVSWTPPPRLLDTMVMETRIKPVVKDYGTLYKAELRFDASPQRRAQLIELYNRELVERRLITLGGTLTFVLICLGAVSGYIRADEATKGYYTNRLRLLAAAGVGAAGVVIYQMVA